VVVVLLLANILGCLFFFIFLIENGPITEESESGPYRFRFPRHLLTEQEENKSEIRELGSFLSRSSSLFFCFDNPHQTRLASVKFEQNKTLYISVN